MEHSKTHKSELAHPAPFNAPVRNAKMTILRVAQHAWVDDRDDEIRVGDYEGLDGTGAHHTKSAEI